LHLGFGQPVVDLPVYLWRVGADEGLDLHRSGLRAKKAPLSAAGPVGHRDALWNRMP
jgi:hypothetical protein